jgi:hypothetical protein
MHPGTGEQTGCHTSAILLEVVTDRGSPILRYIQCASQARSLPPSVRRRPEKNGSGRFSGLLAELIFACAIVGWLSTTARRYRGG